MTKDLRVNKKINLSEVKQIVTDTDEKIIFGLNKKTASTGTPMCELKGGAKIMATISNIGGGSKENGGDGVIGGMDTLKKNNIAKTILKIAKNVKKIGVESNE